MSLRWTPRGAVLAPETLQLRLSPVFSTRVQVGAPTPGRALTDEEIDANVRWFATPGPRGRPISAVVFSGVDRDLTDRIRFARGLVGRIVVHAEPERAREIRGADTIAVAVRSAADVALIDGLPGLNVVVPLEEGVLPVLGELLEAISAERVTLTWPFPVAGQGQAPNAQEVVEVLREVLRVKDKGKDKGKGRVVKGIPRCVLGELEVEVSRTGNRWYVDAEHQRERALLFLPDVLQLAKREACRFCVEDPHCDGVAERWLLQGLAGALVPRRA